MKKTSKVIPSLLMAAFALTQFGVSQAQAYDWNTPQNEIPTTSNGSTTVHPYKLPNEGSERRYGVKMLETSNSQVATFFDAPRMSKLDPLSNEANQNWTRTASEATTPREDTQFGRDKKVRGNETHVEKRAEQRSRTTATTGATSNALQTEPDVRNREAARIRQQRVAQVNADDQARSTQRETDITRMIRSEITSKDNLSTRAKNVTIVTLNGRVFLRGTVNTAAEKTEIERIARQVSRMNVVNETVINE